MVTLTPVDSFPSDASPSGPKLTPVDSFPDEERHAGMSHTAPAHTGPQGPVEWAQDQMLRFGSAAARGVAPMTVGAVAGTALGGLEMAPVGAAAMGLTQLAVPVYNAVADKFGWPKSATPQEMTDKVLDLVGIKKPENVAERIVEAGSGGFASARGMASAANEISGLASAKDLGRVNERTRRWLPPAPVIAQEWSGFNKPPVAPILTSPTGKAVLARMAERPGLQGVSGAAGGGIGQIAAELGAGPTAQTLASMIGASLPYLPALAASGIGVPNPKPAATAAIKSGYVLPPAEIGEGTSKPDLLSRTLSGVAGKIKLWQWASTENQVNTNKLAAKDIGLPEETHLTEQAFEQARAPAAAVYREVEQAVPEVDLSTTEYRSAASNVGKKGGLVEKHFKDASENPDIKAVRDDLLTWEGEARGHHPTVAVKDKIASLRADADRNLRAAGNPDAHRVGLAQLDAANVLEDAMERSVENAPQYFQTKLNQAIAKRAEVTKDLDYYSRSADNTLGTDRSRYMANLRQKVAEANESVKTAQDDLDAANLKGDYYKLLPKRFKDARKLFAKIYTVEEATNRTTGDVSARGLARVYNKGAPFTDGLKTIADTANIAPKSMQMPSMFGHAEDWSALDFYGTTIAAMHGNVPAAAGIAARPYVRGMVLSPSYQQRLIDPLPGPVPVPMVTAPPSGSVETPREQRRKAKETAFELGVGP